MVVLLNQPDHHGNVKFATITSKSRGDAQYYPIAPTTTGPYPFQLLIRDYNNQFLGPPSVLPLYSYLRVEEHVVPSEIRQAYVCPTYNKSRGLTAFSLISHLFANCTANADTHTPDGSVVHEILAPLAGPPVTEKDSLPSEIIGQRTSSPKSRASSTSRELDTSSEREVPDSQQDREQDLHNGESPDEACHKPSDNLNSPEERQIEARCVTASDLDHPSTLHQRKRKRKPKHSETTLPPRTIKQPGKRKRLDDDDDDTSSESQSSDTESEMAKQLPAVQANRRKSKLKPTAHRQSVQGLASSDESESESPKTTQRVSVLNDRLVAASGSNNPDECDRRKRKGGIRPLLSPQKAKRRCRERDDGHDVSVFDAQSSDSDSHTAKPRLDRKRRKNRPKQLSVQDQSTTPAPRASAAPSEPNGDWLLVCNQTCRPHVALCPVPGSSANFVVAFFSGPCVIPSACIAQRALLDGKLQSVSAKSSQSDMCLVTGYTYFTDLEKSTAGSWEDLVVCVRTVEEKPHPETGNLIRKAHLEWVSGKTSKHPLHVVNHQCPQKILAYYERNLTFGNISDPAESDESNDSNDSDEESDYTASQPKAKRRGKPVKWSAEEDANLVKSKGEEKKWDEIFQLMPNRTPGAIQVRCSMLLKKRGSRK